MPFYDYQCKHGHVFEELCSMSDRNVDKDCPECNEKGNIEATVYEVNHKSTKTPSESRSGGKGGSYMGTPSGSISKKKDARVIRSFSPMGEVLKEELIALKDRQSIGKRRQLFR